MLNDHILSLFGFFSKVTGRIGIIAKWFERMRSLFFGPFFSDVFMESPLLDRKVPSMEFLQSLLRRHFAGENSL